MHLQLREMPLRRKKVEDYELKIHSLMLDNTCKYSLIQIERSNEEQVGIPAVLLGGFMWTCWLFSPVLSLLQVVERQHQRIKATRMIASLKQIKQEDQIVVNTFNLANMMRRTRRWCSPSLSVSLSHTHCLHLQSHSFSSCFCSSMETELRNLLGQYSGQERQFKDRSQFLCDDYKRNILQYERIQDQIKWATEAALCIPWTRPSAW